MGTTPPLAGTNHSSSYQGHLNTCSFNVVPCPNRCPTKLSRRDLPAHLQHDCPKRRLKCEFCGCDFSGEAFEVGGAWLRGREGVGHLVARGSLNSAPLTFHRTTRVCVPKRVCTVRTSVVPA